MSKRSDIDLVLDMLEATRRAMAYCRNMDHGGFAQDAKTQDAVVRNIEIVGEAAKNVSDDMRRTYSGVPWKDIAGMRDRLIHGYFGVNWDIVWSVVANDLPGLADTLESILRHGDAG